MYIYYKDETGTYLIGEIMTNRSITVDEALEIAGVDMDKYADANGWDGYDWNCLELSYKLDEDAEDYIRQEVSI